MTLTGLALLTTNLVPRDLVPTGDVAAAVVAPEVILICCVVAAIGVALLLPRRGSLSDVMPKIGGLVLLVALVVILGNVLAYTAEATGAGFLGLGAMGPYFWVFALLAIGASVRVISHPKPVYSALWFVLTIFASAGLFILLFAEFMAAALVTIYAGAILVTYTFVIMLASDAGAERAAVGAEGEVVEVVPDYDQQARDRWAAGAVGFTIAGLLLFATFANAPEILPRQGRLALMPYAPVLNPVVADTAEVAAVGGVTPRPLTGLGAVPADEAGVVSGSTQRLGVYLMTNQLVALQVAGLILTIAMIGAIVIARRKVYSGPSDADDARNARGRSTHTVSTPHTPVDDNPNSLPIRGSKNPRQKAYPQT